MKKLSFILLLLIFVFTLVAFADFNNQNGKIENPDFDLPARLERPLENSNVTFTEPGLEQASY